MYPIKTPIISMIAITALLISADTIAGFLTLFTCCSFHKYENNYQEKIPLKQIKPSNNDNLLLYYFKYAEKCKLQQLIDKQYNYNTTLIDISKRKSLKLYPTKLSLLDLADIYHEKNKKLKTIKTWLINKKAKNSLNYLQYKNSKDDAEFFQDIKI